MVGESHLKVKAMPRQKSTRELNRKKARGMGAVHAPGKAHARLSGRTGSSDHWLARVQRAKALKDALAKESTATRIPECPEAAFVAEAYPTLLALTEAEYRDLLKLKGVGPARLRKLRAYLSSRNVLCYWKVPV
jgi:hypothetical protein